MLVWQFGNLAANRHFFHTPRRDCSTTCSNRLWCLDANYGTHLPNLRACINRLTKRAILAKNLSFFCYLYNFLNQFLDAQYLRRRTLAHRGRWLLAPPSAA